MKTISSGFGKFLKVTISGGSHEPLVCLELSGVPAGESFSFTRICEVLAKRSGKEQRKLGFVTPREEIDIPEFLSGVEREGDTLIADGSTIKAVLYNKDTKSSDYDKYRDMPRPSHADYTGRLRYGNEVSMAGGGPFSARMTAPLCIAGSIAEQILERRGVHIGAHILEGAGIEDTSFEEKLKSSKSLDMNMPREADTICEHGDNNRIKVTSKLEELSSKKHIDSIELTGENLYGNQIEQHNNSFYFYGCEKKFEQLIKQLEQMEIPVIEDTAGEVMKAKVAELAKAGDSAGGIIEVVACGVPAGLGGAMYGGLEGRLAEVLFGVPSVKGVDFGAGFAGAALSGSQFNDCFCEPAPPRQSLARSCTGCPELLERTSLVPENTIDSRCADSSFQPECTSLARDSAPRLLTRTNNNGGILGGVTNGMPILARVAFKPVPSIAMPQYTWNLATHRTEKLEIEGRHDAFVLPRAVPIVKSAMALVLYDCVLERELDGKPEGKLPNLETESIHVRDFCLAELPKMKKVPTDFVYLDPVELAMFPKMEIEVPRSKIEAESTSSALATHRAEIDYINSQIAELFEKRMKISAQIAEIKKAENLPILDKEREEQIIESIRKHGTSEYAPYTEKFFKSIMEISRDYQNNLNLEKQASPITKGSRMETCNKYNKTKSEYLGDIRDRFQKEDADNKNTSKEKDYKTFDELGDLLKNIKQNLVLIGMPGSGKTTMGRFLSEILDRPFIDFDSEVESRARLTVADIFEKYGEAEFRRLEREVALDCAKLSGYVFATGGGTVLCEEAMQALSQNAKVIFIDTPIEILKMDGRPLSTSREALEKIYAERIDLYKRYCDIIFSPINSGKDTKSNC